MIITVQRRNVRAHALYVRLGFEDVSQTDFYTIMEWRAVDATQPA
jgi:hypothetical protein